jgi:predicted RNA-binding Zn ribbon-like protein
LEKEEERLFIRERAEAARQAAQSEIDRSKLRETPEARVERALALLERDRSAMRARLEAKLTRTQHIEEFDKTYFEGEVELTGEECAEQDELPDDLEAGRGE